MPRNPITEHYYPYKLTLDEFIEILLYDIPAFKQNMEDMRAGETLYPEKWIRILAAWYEFEEEE